MKSVESHFPEANRKILTREQATPVSLFGQQSREVLLYSFCRPRNRQPVESARLRDCALEGQCTRQLVQALRPRCHSTTLHADLVTISSCYSAGDRPTRAKGWLGSPGHSSRAGAHNVVAALWDVSDISAVQMMDKFYDELNRGAKPDAALRTAKLSLLRNRDSTIPITGHPFNSTRGRTKESARLFRLEPTFNLAMVDLHDPSR